MNRQLCVLIFSSFSPESRKLIEYINLLPYDLPRLTGLTFLNVDSEQVKRKLLSADITTVPALLVKYFNGEQQQLEGDVIYKWIDLIGKIITTTPPPAVGEADAAAQITNPTVPTDNGVQETPPPQPPVGGDGLLTRRPSRSTFLNIEGLDHTDDTGGGAIEKPHNIMAAALAMQKERETAEPTTTNSLPTTA